MESFWPSYIVSVVLPLILVSTVILIPLCLVDVVRSRFKDSSTKLMWVIIVFFAPFVGSLIYIFYGIRNKVNT